MATSLRRVSGNPARQVIPTEPQFTEEELAAFDRAYHVRKTSGQLVQDEAHSALALDLQHGGAL